MVFKKRQLILAVLVLALGSAVYLNWQFSSDKGFSTTDIVTSTKELGQAQFVNNTVDQQTNSEENKEGSSEPPKNSSEYFSKAKTERQKARDEAIDMIKEILEDTKSSEETKTEAIKQAAVIAKRIEQEANIENLIRAKGFSECLAFIQNDECSVVVSSEGLDESSTISIKDIVYGQGAIALDKIKIIEAKNAQ
ncbi:MAG: hypothetical protein RUMPE_00694 [Eubacteriales bacterium SKADARSKE-1]|nr:hypothetical protein [Eubacteriales bacterium SKADARSKE-1]